MCTKIHRCKPEYYGKKQIRSYQFKEIDFTNDEVIEIFGFLNESCNFYGAISLADFLISLEEPYLNEKGYEINLLDIDHKVGWDSLFIPDEHIVASETSGMWHIILPELKPMSRILR